MGIRRHIAAAAMAATLLQASAVTSRLTPVEITDPQGNAVTVIAVGDEHSRRYINASDAREVSWIASFGSAKSFTPVQRLRAQSGPQKAQQRITTFPTLGENRFLVVLVEFADKAFATADPAGEFDDLFNKPGYDTLGGTGSVADYYRDCSNGLFAPHFDVVGPVKMSGNVAYYGSGSDDSRAGLMVMEACLAIDGTVDFSLYDHDGNGEVDSVYFIYAGKGEADGGEPDTIWPHSWNLSDQGRELTLDGVAVQGYACSPELDGSAKLNGMGTPCHEFAHVLGLPDLYCTNSYVSCLHPSDFSLMARGNYLNDGRTPPALSAYERYELGWLTPRELTHPATIALQPISQDHEAACRIATERKNEYFLLENRQPTGWDTYLPAHGMLVWHIDYSPDIWDRNRVNANPDHQYVDIVEANNATTFTQASGFTFPGSSNVTSLTSSTHPALESWSGTPIDLPITDIKENADGTVSFDVAGGKAPVGTPTGLTLIYAGVNSFSLSWAPATGATHYICRTTPLDAWDTPIGEPSTCTLPDGECIYNPSGLTPGGRYAVEVCGADQYEQGPWSETFIVPLMEPTFEYSSPTAYGPEEVGSDHFTAIWEPMREAKSYRIDVIPQIRGEESFVTVDFTGKTMPEGFTTSSSTWISMAGNYGEAAPSLRLGADGDYIATPEGYNSVSSVSFWVKAQSPDPDARIIIEEIDCSGSASTIATYTPGETPETVRFESNLPEIDCSTFVRIRFVKAGKCTVNIDDLKVGYGGKIREDPPGRIARIAEGADTRSLLIDGLTPATTYGFYVRGYNADNRLSLPSETITFTTADASSLPAIEATDADTPVDVYSISGVCLLRSVTLAEARRFLPPGLYIAAGRLLPIP